MFIITLHDSRGAPGAVGCSLSRQTRAPRGRPPIMSLVTQPTASAPGAPSNAVRRAAVPASPEILATLQARLAAGAGELDRSGAFPFDNLAALHEAGLIAAVVPTAAGGGGATLAEARRIL